MSGLRNHSVKQIILPKQTAVGEIAPANIIPSLSSVKANRIWELMKKNPQKEKGKLKIKKEYKVKLT